MTHEMKIEYMKIAAGVCCLGFSFEQLDLLVSLYELVLQKEGETDLRSMVDVKIAAKRRAEEREVAEAMREKKEDIV
jgi:hypothetical protein